MSIDNRRDKSIDNFIDDGVKSKLGLPKFSNNLISSILSIVIGFGACSGSSIKNAYGQGIPGMPINYWGCGECSPSTGAFRDGLPFSDGKLVELMMDCDNDGVKEQNVNRSQVFPVDLTKTLHNGSYNIDVYPETATVCGYNDTMQSRNKGDARIDGLIAYPRDLAFTIPGSSIPQRLDTFTDNLRMQYDNALGITTADWTPGNPEATGYDVIRGDVANLQASGGLAGATVTQIGICNTASTTISGIPELDENPAVGSSYFYMVRPRNLSGLGNYGGDSSGIPRLNPIVGDCL